jgi:hypothetical protein
MHCCLGWIFFSVLSFLQGPRISTTTQTWVTSTKLSIERKMFLPCGLHGVFTFPRHRKSCTKKKCAEVCTFNISIVGFPDVAGVLAVGGVPTIAEIHDVTGVYALVHIHALAGTHAVTGVSSVVGPAVTSVHALPASFAGVHKPATLLLGSKIKNSPLMFSYSHSNPFKTFKIHLYTTP